MNGAPSKSNGIFRIARLDIFVASSFHKQDRPCGGVKIVAHIEFYAGGSLGKPEW
jgi:hypothetical protein